MIYKICWVTSWPSFWRAVSTCLQATYAWNAWLIVHVHARVHVPAELQVSVLDKSKMDWQDFKKSDKEVQEELEAHGRSDKQYLDKQVCGMRCFAVLCSAGKLLELHTDTKWWSLLEASWHCRAHLRRLSMVMEPLFMGMSCAVVCCTHTVLCSFASSSRLRPCCLVFALCPAGIPQACRAA
jgi:hypothetical protein